MITDPTRIRVSRLAARRRPEIEAMLRAGNRQLALDTLAELTKRRNMECTFTALNQAELEIESIERQIA